jgi:hypothetical protein
MCSCAAPTEQLMQDPAARRRVSSTAGAHSAERPVTVSYETSEL